MQLPETRLIRRRLTVVAAVVLAALVTVPAIARSRTLADQPIGKPSDPGLRDSIGLVLRLRPGSSFTTPPRYVAGVRTTRGLVLLWARLPSPHGNRAPG